MYVLLQSIPIFWSETALITIVSKAGSIDPLEGVSEVIFGPALVNIPVTREDALFDALSVASILIVTCFSESAAFVKINEPLIVYWLSCLMPLT